MTSMSELPIRQYGDPVLKERARDVEDIDGAVASLVESMIETMYAAPGTGLAANQVGVQRRIFVYDVGEGAQTVINPRIVETDGEWVYEEGCLSVPGLSWEIARPNAVHLVGLDLDGSEISIEATELQGRVFQHELDHLDGILLVERLDEDQRKEALKILRARTLDRAAADPDGLSKLFTR
jgi:peptide deformylase